MEESEGVKEGGGSEADVQGQNQLHNHVVGTVQRSRGRREEGGREEKLGGRKQELGGREQEERRSRKQE